MPIFVTSDNHFGHERIIELCCRPFKDVADMDGYMIEQWNAVVAPMDLVYHLGDFCLGDEQVALSYFRQLNGQIRILLNPWHHDKRWIRGFQQRGDLHVESKYAPIMPLNSMEVLELPYIGDIRDGKGPYVLTLCHYPMDSWERRFQGGGHLHGHSHGRFPQRLGRRDVSVDATCFAPVELNDLTAELYKETVTNPEWDPTKP